MKSLLTFFSFLIALFLSIPASGERLDDPYIGKRLYQSFCLVCHGPNGDTKGPLAKKLGLKPPNLTKQKYQKKSIDEMAKIIGGYGRVKGDIMPVWRNALPEVNIKHIAAYLAVIKSKSLRFRGNKRKGRLIFKSSCSACHGPTGTGNGILAKLIGAPMVDFTKTGSIEHLNDGQLVKIIRDGKDSFMPGWKGTLNSDEITDVAAYVKSLGK
ncbi:MAG: c-type cytochrome [Nitrospinota bacterium]